MQRSHEALLDPRARIAPGFGTVELLLRGGERVNGLLRAESESDLVIAAGTPVVDRRIPKADVVDRTNGPSSMPPYRTVLGLRDIRMRYCAVAISRF